MTYFPMCIKLEVNQEVRVIDEPKDIPVCMAFTVLQTSAEETGSPFKLGDTYVTDGKCFPSKTIRIAQVLTQDTRSRFAGDVRYIDQVGQVRWTSERMLTHWLHQNGGVKQNAMSRAS